MWTRFSHLRLALQTIPGLLFDKQQRHLLAQMRAFIRRLPQLMQSPANGMKAISQECGGDSPAGLSEETIRRLADLAALFARRSPLGLCLRRSLLRYRYLRPAGVPLAVYFGAKLLNDQRQLTGHAWVVLGGQPYYEADENWRNFQVMLRWPDDK